MKRTLRQIVFGLAALAAVQAWPVPPAAAQGAQDAQDAQAPRGGETFQVMDHQVEPLTGLYRVIADVNVRAGPGTDFKRLLGLDQGDQVRAVGKPADKDWIVVNKDGETLGFVYAPVLTRVVDGELSEQFFGTRMVADKHGGVACDYRFRFDGKVPVEGAGFDTADYEIRFRCASAGGARIFYAHMYLTEGVVDEQQGLHLIGLDVRSIGDGMDEFLETRYHYHPKSGRVSFEGHSLPRFALPPAVLEFESASIKDALTRALEAAIDSWTEEAWTHLFAKAG